MIEELQHIINRWREEFAIKQAINHVLSSHTYHGYLGHPAVHELESKLSRIFGGFPVIAVNSGSDALIIAMKAAGINPEDEVIVPAFSFISTASSVAWINATPVFADISENDYAIDPAKIEKKITSKTKAIIITHLFGQPSVHLEQIKEIAKSHGLILIEDAAQGFGGRIKTKEGKWLFTGTVGDIGCFSFSSSKTFAGPGHGGAILCKDKSIARAASLMRYYGAERHYHEYPVVGTNAILHEIQAASLLAELPFFSKKIERRKKLSDLYSQSLQNTGDLILPHPIPETDPVYYRYVVRTRKRDELFDYLKKTFKDRWYLHPSKNYPVLLPHFSAFEKFNSKKESFPIAEKLSKEVISLPLNNLLSKREADKICDHIRIFFKI